MRNLFSESQTRAWLQIRAESFVPRIKRTKKTKAAPYVFGLEELAVDMSRTLEELKVRIREGRKQCNDRDI